MNIGTVLIEHDYNASPLKGTQTFSLGRPTDAQREKWGIGIKKRKKPKECGLRTNGRKNARQKLHAVNNMKRMKSV
jgi:hypothetical protein